MYLKHFKLSKMPFENVCDTDFFFESGNHKEAYSRLAYAIEEKKPCAALTGGYGTGKTFVLKAVERDLRRKGYLFSSVNNPRLDDLGLLRIILHGFTGYEVPARKEDVLMGIEKFLKDTNRDGKHVVVAVDEAQDIDDQKVFEELRLLLNYQTESRSKEHKKRKNRKRGKERPDETRDGVFSESLHPDTSPAVKSKE